ncbi:uncharacterized protein [Paramisgurnus dabryanus]|uniref:uncharacterized protein n=1 Tax=Paramisgurnus dabryanus TaxID=90735 RepID=UPI0031F3CF78
MATVLWVFLLCLHGCLLTHALDCAGRGADCAGTQVTEAKVKDNPFSFLLRTRRQAQHGVQRPGSYSVKGSPNTLIQMTQADKPKKHWHNSKRKTNKSRIGSYSLLEYNPAINPIQATSVHKPFKDVDDPKLAALKSIKRRTRRSAPKRNKTRNTTCS